MRLAQLANVIGWAGARQGVSHLSRPLPKQWADRLDLGIVLAASCLTVLFYLHMHSRLGPVAAPALDLFQGDHRTPPANYGWWSWWDQGAYIQAALAWAHGIVDPAYHWYLPGYPLLGALFVRITPAEPFMLPDLICLVGSLWLFAALAARLMGRTARYGRAAGAAVFVATAVLPQKALWSWVVPWTTTPETVCLFACLLAAARFTEDCRPRDAFLAMLAGVGIAGFRPADAAVAVAVSGAIMSWSLAERRPGWPRVRAIAIAALLGAASPLLLFGGAYLAVWGAALSGYVTLSQAYGFEWRLLPLRWVELMIDPKPIFPDGRGLAAVFPWIAPGVLGMAACLAAPGGVPRRLHVLVIAATLLDCAAFLTYRDLQPTGLWQFGNFHYFKGTLPVFGLYALLLLHAVARRPSRAAAVAAAACATLGLFMWRVELVDPVHLTPATAQGLSLPSGLSHIDDVLLARAKGDPFITYMGNSQLLAGDAVFRNSSDFKFFLWSDTLMALPLRPLPAVPSTFTSVMGATLDPDAAPVLARQALVWGLPCWVTPNRVDCRIKFLFRPPTLPLDEVIEFGGTGAEDYLIAGWSVPDPAGRWTTGPRASFRFGLPVHTSDEEFAVDIAAHGYAARRGDEPTRVTIAINGKAVAKWRLGAGEPSRVRVPIPHDGVAADNAVMLDLSISNPRQPWLDLDIPDGRDLGRHVEPLRLVANQESSDRE